jgi:hypothetical protein
MEVERNRLNLIKADVYGADYGKRRNVLQVMTYGKP